MPSSERYRRAKFRVPLVIMVSVALTFSALALLVTVKDSAAQSFPSRPVKLIVPFPPGGSLDIVGRAIAQKLTEAWGQSVVVDNRPGAGGNIGADLVAKAAPDGYTVVMGALSTHAVNPSHYAKMPYDAVKDFAPITLVALPRRGPNPHRRRRKSSPLSSGVRFSNTRGSSRFRVRKWIEDHGSRTGWSVATTTIAGRRLARSTLVRSGYTLRNVYHR